jgi:monovalent cation:H+ antiporter-2, CPA2 family
VIHLPEIISDLALLLITAAVVTLIFRKLKQPVVLGYIIAGIFVGPHVKWMPGISDVQSVKYWAEIGVIFLLFSLGLEFSFKKLLRIGGPATITALVEISTMLVIGYTAGRLFGWNVVDSLFLGGIISISSTTIIIRALDELGMKTRGFVHLVFGVLVVEDVVAVVLMVLLSTFAIGKTFSGVEMTTSVLKLVFFLALWFILGMLILPTLIKKIRHLLSEETLLLVAVGLCFLMVVLATQAGFSPALGAFMMGSLLAETSEGKKIEHLILPVRDLFAAVFFVSVGMLFDPGVLQENWGVILIVTAILMIGKTFGVSFGALLSGQTLKTSVQTGMSLAQIGEFSFIIASIGLTLNVISESLYPIAIAVSAITTFTTPYMIRSADWVHRLLESRMSVKTLEYLNRFSSDPHRVSGMPEWKSLLRSYLGKIGANGIVVVAIYLLVEKYFYNETNPYIGLLIGIVGSSPFLWAMAFSKMDEEKIRTLWPHARYKNSILFIELFRRSFAVVLMAILSMTFVSPLEAIAVAGFLGITVIFILSKRLGPLYSWLEGRFVSNLTETDRNHINHRKPLSSLAPWDAHLVEFEVPAHSGLVGKSLAESTVRERFGVTVALLTRGSRMLPAPNRDQVVYPGDRLGVIGNDDQIARFKAEIEKSGQPVKEAESVNYSLGSYLVLESSPFVNKSIRECGIRERANGLVVGIERSGQRILNPDSGITIKAHDLLWIVGDHEKMRHLNETEKEKT